MEVNTKVLEQSGIDTKTRDVDIREVTRQFASEYDPLFLLYVYEIIQNSGDGWGMNIQDGNIPKRELEILINVLVDENRVIGVDNAGGMSRESMEKIGVGISEKRDREEGGGSFGIALATMAGSTDDGYVYLESKDAETGEHIARVLRPDGEDTEVMNAVELRESLGIDLPVPGFEERDTEGTITLVHGVGDREIESLQDTQKVYEKVRWKFLPFIGRDDVNITYSVDGEETEFTATPFDEILGDTYEEYEQLQHPYGSDDLMYDRVVFSELNEDVPWEKMPLIKSLPYFGTPFMVVDDYGPKKASTLIGDDKILLGWVIVDTICEDTTREDSSHQNINLKHSAILKEVAQGVSQKWIRENDPFEIGASEEEIEDAIIDGFDLTNKTAATIIGDEFSDNITFNITARDTESPDNETAAIEFNLSADGINAEQDVTIEVVELEHMEEDDYVPVLGETIQTFVSPDEEHTLIAEFDVEKEGAYWVRANLLDSEGNVLDSTANTVGVNRDLTSTPPSTGGGGGGGGVTESAGQLGGSFTISRYDNIRDGEDGLPIRTEIVDADNLEFAVGLNKEHSIWTEAGMQSKEEARKQAQMREASVYATESAIDDFFRHRMLDISEREESLVLKEKVQRLKQEVRNQIESQYKY